MISCPRKNRWGNFSDTCRERPSNTAAVKEMESKLSHTLAERAKQDALLWGVDTSTSMKKTPLANS